MPEDANCPSPKCTTYVVAEKPQKQPDKKKGGRPRNVNKRGIRGLIRTTEKVRRDNANFTVKQLRENAGISHLASRRMFWCYLNEIAH